MHSITQWAISIIGAAVLTLIADVILPDGKIRKYIKGVMAIVIAYIIMTPLVTLFNRHSYADLSSALTSSQEVFSGQSSLVDEHIIDTIVNQRISTIENDISQLLNNSGFDNVRIDTQYEVINNYPLVHCIVIDLREFATTVQESNRAKAEIQSLLTNNLGINPKMIEFIS